MYVYILYMHTYIYVSRSDKRVHLVKSIHCGYDGKIPFRLRIFKYSVFCENRIRIVSRMFSESEIVIRQVDFEIRYWIQLPEVRPFCYTEFSVRWRNLRTQEDKIRTLVRVISAFFESF